MVIFKVLDYHDITVILSHQTWYKKLLDPVFGHPEVESYLSHIKLSIQKPDYVYQSLKDHRSNLFFKKLSTSTFSRYYLVVVVKYVAEDKKTVGYISTVMINRKLPKEGKLIWGKLIST
jgi:hypothetical protein